MIELTPEFLDRYVNLEGREKIALSRQLTPSQKLAMGGLLFDRECEIIKKLIRETFPDANDEVILGLLRHVVRWYHGDD